ncbi:MAG: type IV secretion system protein VirB10 [Litorimonas sp.]
MARAPEEYPQDIETDRDIQPLATKNSRLTSIFFIIAAVGGLLLLLILQLFSNGRTGDVPEIEQFRPVTANIELPVPPSAPEPIVVPTPQPETQSKPSRFNPLELERLRQLALLEEQKTELERQRLVAIESEKKRRRQSEMLVLDSSASGIGDLTATPALNDLQNGPNGSPFGFGDIPDETQVNQVLSDPNERFLRDASDIQVVEATALKLENQETLVTQGTFISGVLETAINSDLPGLLRAVVDKNIYGRTGQVIVIPKGSRLIGRYRSNLSNGQSRVFVVWSRLERPDGVVADLGSPGTDQLGVAGLGGVVDTHFVERFGAATFLSIIGPITALLVDEAIGTDNDQTTNIINGSQQSFSDAASIALENSISRPPTIHVDQGSEITIFVNRDISFHNVGGSQP